MRPKSKSCLREQILRPFPVLATLPVLPVLAVRAPRHLLRPGVLQEVDLLDLLLGPVQLGEVDLVGAVVAVALAAELALVDGHPPRLALVHRPLVEEHGVATLELLAAGRAGMVQLPALPRSVACNKSHHGFFPSKCSDPGFASLPLCLMCESM